MPWTHGGRFWLGYGVLAAWLKWGHLVIPDEGVTLTESWQVSQGLVPLRDFFDFLTPGSLYLLAAAFGLFGATYAVAKIFSLLLFLSSAYALDRIDRQLGLRGGARALALLLWLLLSNHYVVINHNIYALVASLWAIERLLAAAASKVWWPYLVAGAFGGATVWMQQARGLAVIVAAVLWLVALPRWRQACLYLAGAAGVLTPLLWWPLPALYFSFVEFPLRYYYPINQLWVTPWLMYLLLSGYAAVAAGLLARTGQTAARWLFWASGLLLLASAFSRPDPAHLLPLSFPLAVLLTLWLQESERGGLQRCLATLTVGVGIGLTFASLTIVTARMQAVGLRAFLELRDPRLERLVNFVQAEVPPQAPIFAAPYLPNLYFEAKRRNPTPLNMLIYGHHPDVIIRQTANALAADPPTLILLNYYVEPEAFSDFLVGYPITDFVRQHYDYRGEMNGVKIFQFRASAQPALPLPS